MKNNNNKEEEREIDAIYDRLQLVIDDVISSKKNWKEDWMEEQKSQSWLQFQLCQYNKRRTGNGYDSKKRCYKRSKGDLGKKHFLSYTENGENELRRN